MNQIYGYSEVKEYMCIVDSLVEKYQIYNYRKRIVSYGFNVIFEIFDIEQKKRYAARISDSKIHNYSSIMSEINIINCLKSYYGDRICTVIKDNDGNYLNTIFSENHSVYYGCIFEWIEYPFMSNNISKDYVMEMGEAIAELHNITENMNFVDKELERLDLSGNGICKIMNESNILSRFRDKDTIAKGIECVENLFNNIDKSRNNYGLIHGDIYYKNIFLIDGRIGFIDFDLCSYGFYFEDLMIFDWPQGYQAEKMIELLFIGYRKKRNIDVNFYEIKDPIKILYYLKSLVYLEIKHKKSFAAKVLENIENDICKEMKLLL